MMNRKFLQGIAQLHKRGIIKALVSGKLTKSKLREIDLENLFKKIPISFFIDKWHQAEATYSKNGKAITKEQFEKEIQICELVLETGQYFVINVRRSVSCKEEEIPLASSESEVRS